MSHGFDTDSKMQSIQWKHPGSPLPKKCIRVHSAGKVIASIFWDSQRVIMIGNLEQDRTINDAYFAGELRWLRQIIARKRLNARHCSTPTLKMRSHTNIRLLIRYPIHHK